MPTHENHFVLQGPVRAEIQVQCQMSESLLQGSEIEDQTQVVHDGKTVLLWQALKEITLRCLAQWEACGEIARESFIREALAAKESAATAGQTLVLGALSRPLLPRAIARTLQLGHNFLRTLDICLEALLRYPSQKSLTRKPLRTQVVIDWAVGGISEWACNFPYSFETGTEGKKPPPRLAHVSRHYGTDRGARSQISHKQIANIFLLRDSTVADLERRGMAQLRTKLAGDALDGADQD